MKITGIAILSIMVLATAAFQIFFRLPIPSYTGSIDLPGLKKPVEVKTDKHAIPHIFAKNHEDLFFAQGYITARERMFQMDLTRLAGRGELSELLGEKTVRTDRYFRTLGLYRAAESEYEHLTPEAKMAVDAYTRGVNAYISTVKHLPREYVILGAKPQEWKPADSIVGALLMSYRLVSPRSIKPLLYQISVHAGPEALKKLLPWTPAFAPVISGDLNPFPSALEFNFPGSLPKATEAAIVPMYSPIPLRMRASNWMILSGSRTTTEKPIFAGSPDLEASIPSLFYMIHLKGPSYDVIGGSIAGMPGVHALGFNGKMAWSITVGNGDNVDFFIETPNPDNDDQYLTESGYKDFVVINETIRIKSKGGFNEEKIKIKISRHGPVVSDVMQGLPDHCTMLWPALMGRDGTLSGLLGVNRASSFEEFREALSTIRGASVHIGYADVNGNIGYQYLTTFPMRKSGENPLPMPGKSGRHDWTGFIPFEEHPFALNPEKGYLASFNQMPAVGNYYGTSYFLFERAYRFEELIREKEKFTPDDVRRLQNDTGSHVAQIFIPLISSACSAESSLAPHIAMLAKWDRFIGLGSPEATLFNSFITHLIRNTFEDQLGKHMVDELFSDLHVSIPLQWLIRYMDANTGFFWDDIRTESTAETRDDMIVKSMRDAVHELQGRYGKNADAWSWGKVHKMKIKHPLGSVLPFLNLGPYSYPGDDFTIHAGWWKRDNPFEMYSGAAIRIIVDMADLSAMTIMSPPGQSGHFLSPHYSDLGKPWARGEQVPAHYTSAKQLENLLMLMPPHGQ